MSVALLLGAASPALAAPGKGHAYGHAPATKPAKPAKPAHPDKGPKTKQGHLSGGGTSANGVGFSVQAKWDKLKQAHFNYGTDDETSDTTVAAAAPATTPVTVRCRPFTSFVRADNKVDVAATCVASGPGYTKVPATLAATFVDNGKAGDVANITVTRSSDQSTLVSDSGVIKSGNIKVHP
jgi:hypothetical protein